MISIINILNYRNILVFIFIASTVATLTALIAEYIFGLRPCILCIYERIPYILTIIFSILGITILKLRKPMLILCLLTFICSTALSLYHAGVEYQIFEGTSSCNSSSSNKTITLEELRTQILDNSRPSCSEVSFRFMGVSITGWNAILSLTLSYLSYIVLRRPKYE
ncbi:MAG: disulfide bond formation protein B [Rickettsiales endosymbiont of Dermacentor nuttalli]